LECLLRLENVVAGYGSITVLNGINLEIPSKGRILLIGPNGAGKSTVFKVISGLVRPKEGKIFFNGRDITNWSIKKRVKAGLGYLLQTDNVIPSLTGEENMELSGAFLPKEEFRKGYWK
jgi:ABC-type branched-subunit amino acid transport system ATPase component